MRILHLIPTMLGGGAERQLCYLAEGQVREGHGVHVAYLLDGPNTARLKRTGAVVHRLGWYRTFNPFLLGALSSLVRSIRPDVVQTWMRRMDVLGGAVSRLHHLPWVYSERNVWTGGGGWRERLKVEFVGRCSAVVANSEAGASYWRRRTKAPVFVAPNIVPAHEIAVVTPIDLASIGLVSTAPMIAFAGRFEEQKNIPLLLDVLDGTLRKCPDAVAVCCGIGPLQQWFVGELGRRGLAARARCLGYREDVWSILKRAQVVLSTSSYEGRPNVILEAMAVGAPIALTDIPSHREIVPGSAAFYFQANADKGVDAVVEALSAPRAAQEKTRRARELVAGLSPEFVVRTYSSIYQQVIDRNG